MDLCDIWTNISKTVNDMSNVSMKDIYEVIYDLSVYLMTFYLGCHLKVKSRSQNFKSLYLINNAFYDQSFMKYIDSMSYMNIQFLSWHLTFDDTKRANQAHAF